METAPHLFDLAGWQWELAILAGMLVGVAKTGVPGVGILMVLIMAHIFPAGPSTGILLPMLIVGDIFAVAYYRRHAEWPLLLKALPWAVVGILLGFLAIRFYQPPDVLLKKLIGIIVLVVLAMGWWIGRGQAEESVPHRWWFAAFLGMLGGFTTMAANAAGPIFIAYFLAFGLPKREFIGTGAWLFLVLNLFKVPFSASLGYITLASLRFDAMMVPSIFAGAVLGIVVMKALPQVLFTRIVTVLAAVAAIRMLLA